MTTATDLSTLDCIVTEDAFARVRDSQGLYFEPLQDLDPNQFAADTLDPTRADEAATVLQRIVSLQGKRVLEIGAGCGVMHIVWSKKFGIDGYAIEPEQEGFGESAAIARDLIAANGLDPERIIGATGESLPFEDNHFDIVYSSNVLEHTADPMQVLREAVRVVRPGGIVQLVCPNYLSYFDGHYAAFHPPIFSNRFFCWWMKTIYGKNPAFAATIRTELNPVWARREIIEISETTPLELLGLGQDVFRERMGDVAVGRWMALGKVGRIVRWAAALKLNRIAAEIAVLLQGWTPLIVTVRKRV
ncbi:MAG: class I SAM-dependent methyltransferase [Rhodospirillaceae bacterium]|jgi:ubiquinone/menaquinone biosynthesis C-methylase UbiE|nr:class I SAM-dependent methyltransferase [Rhodospirillaceae bacterium]